MAEDRGWMYISWDKGETIRMSGWTRPQLFWSALSRDQCFCGAHIAYARIRGVWRTIEPLPYTCVRMVSCQAMRFGHFMASQVPES
jgi:hypothetical protein